MNLIQSVRPRLVASYAAGAFISVIFIDSLRFKFTGHPTPQHIFTTLRDWSGIELFYPAGPWIIGLGELLAALLLMALPLTLRFIGQARLAPLSQVLGGVLALAIMTGAISFHLFTPLGIATPTLWENGRIVEQGNVLFIAACITWVCGALIVVLRGREAVAAAGPLMAPHPARPE
jgi:uncharacterized membrane protein YkgB